MKFGKIKEIRPLLGAKRLLVIITGVTVNIPGKKAGTSRAVTPEVIASFSLGTTKALNFCADQLARITGVIPTSARDTLVEILGNPDKYVGIAVRYTVEAAEGGYENISVYPESNAIPKEFVDRLFSTVSLAEGHNEDEDEEGNAPF